MALNIIERDEDSLKVELNNGDLNALDEIIQNWKFKDESAALRFALAALSTAKKGNLYFKQEDGSIVLLGPTPLLVQE